MKTTSLTPSTATVTWAAVTTVTNYKCTIDNNAALVPTDGIVAKGTETIKVTGMTLGTGYTITCITQYNGADSTSAKLSFKYGKFQTLPV